MNHLGVTYESSTVSTGIGTYLAHPILRKAVEGREDSLTRDEAANVLMNCMKVLICGDTKAYNKVRFYKFEIITKISYSIKQLKPS